MVFSQKQYSPTLNEILNFEAIRATLKTFAHILKYYTSYFITKFQIKNSMNATFNIRSSIRPSFPIHPFAYLQNLLKNSYQLVMA